MNIDYWTHLHEILICGYIRRMEKKYEFYMIIPMEISIIISQCDDELFEYKTDTKYKNIFNTNPIKLHGTTLKQQQNASSIASIVLIDHKKLITISSNYYTHINVWNSSKLTIDDSPRTISFLTKNMKLNKHKICDSNKISSKISNKTLCFQITKYPFYIIVGGFHDNSFKIWDINKSKIIKSIKYHKDIVSCLCIDDNILVTASYDKSVVIWTVKYITNNKHKVSVDINKSNQISQETEVVSVHLSLISGILAIGLFNGSVNIYDSSTIQKISTFQPYNDVSDTFIINLSYIHNHILYHAKERKHLFLYSSSGLLINSCSTDNDTYNDIVFSKCCKYILCGGKNGQIDIKEIPTLKTCKTLNKIKGKTITKLYLNNNEECIFSGLHDGQIAIHALSSKDIISNRVRTLEDIGF